MVSINVNVKSLPIQFSIASLGSNVCGEFGKSVLKYESLLLIIKESTTTFDVKFWIITGSFCTHVNNGNDILCTTVYLRENFSLQLIEVVSPVSVFDFSL